MARSTDEARNEALTQFLEAYRRVGGPFSNFGNNGIGNIQDNPNPIPQEPWKSIIAALASVQTETIQREHDEVFKRIGADEETLKTAMAEVNKRLADLREELKQTIVPQVWQSMFSKEYEKAIGFHHTLLAQTPVRRDVTKAIEALLSEAKTTIRIVGWVDSQYLDKLHDAKNRGVAIKAIVKKPDDNRSAVDRVVETIGRENMVNNGSCHSRFLVVDDKEAIVGTADFNAPSASGHYEVAIQSNEPSFVLGLISHFNEVWEDSQSRPFTNDKEKKASPIF